MRLPAAAPDGTGARSRPHLARVAIGDARVPGERLWPIQTTSV